MSAAIPASCHSRRRSPPRSSGSARPTPTRSKPASRARSSKIRLASPGSGLPFDPFVLRALTGLRFRVRDELEQGPVRVPEVDARAGAPGAETLDGALLDLDAVLLQVSQSVLDRARPLEAEVAVARLHGELRARRGVHARAVQVELLISEPVGPP